MDTSKQKINNPPLFPFFSIVSVIYFIYYLWWRATVTLNPELPFFSWALWGAEAFGLLSFCLFYWFTRNIDPLHPHVNPTKGIKVDIFVPTYNEEVFILEATLVGCKKIRYPHTTYVLDDGNRPHVKELANRMGCQYIARPTHEHAKAGNINYALQHTDGEFIVVLDADMVPQPEYLDRTLGYFKDEKLALIQLPQEFYNQDSIQHDNKAVVWHEQSLFFRVIQPGKNYTNSSFWCGTPSVIRRKALLDVGGVATETVTEDIHTSVRLHSRGWKTLFVNEPLAFGIAPQTIKAFLLQRKRWAQGTMQLYSSKESPFWISGLSLEQRLSYISSFLAYFESFQKIILLLIPVLILLLDILPMRIGVVPFVLHWIPCFTLNILANNLGGRGVFNLFKTEKYNLLKTIVFIESTVYLVSKKPLKFKVTPKTVDDSVYRQERVAMKWHIGIIILMVIALIYSVVKIFIPQTYPITWEVFGMAMVWTSYNAYVLFLALREIFSKRHERQQYRFKVDEKAIIHNVESDQTLMHCNIVDLSITGAGLLVDQGIPERSKKLNLVISSSDFGEFVVPIKKIFKPRKHSSGKNIIGISFSKDLGIHRERLFEYLFVHMPNAEEQTLFKVNEWNPLKFLQNF